MRPARAPITCRQRGGENEALTASAPVAGGRITDMVTFVERLVRECVISTLRNAIEPNRTHRIGLAVALIGEVRQMEQVTNTTLPLFQENPA